jgi:hypothetical protein
MSLLEENIIENLVKDERYIPVFKAANDRLILLLGANAAGDCKLKVMIAYHNKNSRALL